MELNKVLASDVYFAIPNGENFEISDAKVLRTSPIRNEQRADIVL